MENQGAKDRDSYKQPSYQPYREENVGVLDWILTLFVLGIPCINLFMLIIWAFASSKKSKRNYMRAKLIIMVLWTLFGIMLVFCFSGELSRILNDLNQNLQEIMQQLPSV